MRSNEQVARRATWVPGHGRQLAFNVSTQAAPYQRIELVGTKGRLEIEIPFNAPPDSPCRYGIDDASSLSGSGMRWVTLPVADQYQLQGEAFSRAVRGEQPLGYGVDDYDGNGREDKRMLASAGLV